MCACESQHGVGNKKGNRRTSVRGPKPWWKVLLVSPRNSAAAAHILSPSSCIANYISNITFLRILCSYMAQGLSIRRAVEGFARKRLGGLGHHTLTASASRHLCSK